MSVVHAFVTIAVPFDDGRLPAVEEALDRLKNPASDAVRDIFRPTLRVHFLSMSVVPGERGRHPPFLVLEGSFDGTDDDALRLLSEDFGTCLGAVLEAAGSPCAGAQQIRQLLVRRRVRVGQGLFARPGLNFAGAPGMSVRRIRAEFRLARRVRELFEDQPPGTPLETLRRIRATIAAESEHSDLLRPEEPYPDAGPSAELSLTSLAFGALRAFGWPILLLIALLTAIAVAAAWWAGGAGYAALAGFVAFLASTLAAAFGIYLVYLKLRRLERTDRAADVPPDRHVLAQVVERENAGEDQQNHLFGVSTMKPGLIRALTLRLVFWVIARAALTYRPGFLGELGTIHFARWARLPGTDKLLFFSNFGGSWESYLEDFITKAHGGLTAVWSNTADFPRTRNVFQQGAVDGDRFKRWARRQQRPTRFWYSAYPFVTTERIRVNAAIRHGLAVATTEDQAAAWLSCIGSRPRPAGAIETADVQKLMFGGLGPLSECECLLLRLPPSVAEARTWLCELEPELSFGEGPLEDFARIVAFTASGLVKLGLTKDDLDRFPFAFTDGMDSPNRSRILRDTGEDKSENWSWGNAAIPVDAVLLLYRKDESSLVDDAKAQLARLARLGGESVYRVRTNSVDPRRPAREPFGFVDGVSQPMIRGTRLWTPDADPIHVVAPGEFILGYPDDRGNLPLSPTVPAESDPLSRLPSLHRSTSPAERSVFGQEAQSRRDLGCNGSFLVIRQLEQKVEAFNAYVREQADVLIAHPQPGALPTKNPREMEEWVAAKLVGRWRDGTSLVRNPVRPGGGWPWERRDDEPDPVPDNSFLYGAEDPQGFRCPFGAHIRRSNPRDSMNSATLAEIPIVNRHRILRVGRSYREKVGDEVRQGLLFVCLNADIERQFEFIQQTWAMARTFHGLDGEVDSVLGRGHAGGRLTIPAPERPVLLSRLRDYVDVRGGAYFFMPGRMALRYLSSPTSPSDIRS